MGSGYRPPEGARFDRADFCEAKIMGKPLAPRQGATLSAVAVAVAVTVAFASQGRVRVGAPAFGVGVAGRTQARMVGKRKTPGIRGDCSAGRARAPFPAQKGPVSF